MYKELVLNNGLTLVYEKLPFVRSVSFGLWIGTGSRYETYEQNGISTLSNICCLKVQKQKRLRT